MLRWLLSVRGKILVTIFGVSVIVLALGAWAAFRAVTEAKEVGRYLEGPFRHYHGTIDSGDDGAEAVARTLAADPGLTSALATGKAEDIQAAADRLAAPLQGTLTPDWVILSDTAGTTYRVGKFKSLSAEQWREYRSFQDLVKQGSLVKRVGVIAQRPHRIAGAAVRSEGRVVGALLLAESLQTYFWDVADASGERAKDQHRLVLLSRDKVLAKSIKDDEVPSFIESFRAPRWISDGRGSIPVLTLGGVDHDYWSEPLYGYERSSDPTTHQVGALVLVKARDQSEQLADTYRGVAVAFLIALVLALSFGYVLAVQITRPLRAYIAATESLARGQGDLSRRLPVQTRDELGSLAQNLNRVFAKIHTLAAGVQRTAFQVTASSGEISSMSKQMLDGAKEQAKKISGSTAAVTELSSSIQQVAENAAEATRTAKQTGQAVERAIERLGRIRSTVEDAARRIGTLGESSKRIGNIVEVIRQISEQTTMLALNAAIEAAHAGEHGRGFAVVADEVSSLAKRTGQSAKDIEDLIATIRDQTTEAVRVMQTGTHEVEEGTGLVEATLADLRTLVNVIDDTASAVQEQAVASDEIARNMDAVQRIADDVLDSSEQAVLQGNRLLSLADELGESVKGFKIDPERVALDERELKALPETTS